MKEVKVINAFSMACHLQKNKISLGKIIKYQFTSFPKKWNKERTKLLEDILHKLKLWDKKKIERLHNIYLVKSSMNIFKFMSFGVTTLFTIETIVITIFLALIPSAKNDTEFFALFKTLCQLWVIITLPCIYFMWVTIFSVKSYTTQKYAQIIPYLDEILLSSKKL